MIKSKIKNYKTGKMPDGSKFQEAILKKIPLTAKIRKELINAIKNEVFYDLSDVGNYIGVVIGKYTNKKREDKMGYDKDDFIQGVEHGISLSDGTHG